MKSETNVNCNYDRKVERETQLTNTWILEKEGVTGFSFKEMCMLLIIIVLITFGKTILN